MGRLLPRTPRELARLIARLTPLRAEVLGGSLVLSRTDCATRTAAVRLLADGLGAALDAAVLGGPAPEGGLLVGRALPVAMPFDPDDFAVPDLVVRAAARSCAAVAAEPGGGLLDVRDVLLAVEVVPRQEKAGEPGHRMDWYAVACVPALLVVDPRYGTWALHTGPDRTGYRETLAGRFGEEVPLPAPPGGVLATGGVPRYAEGAPV
ncbi:Uma2 family endonuclease [Streptomyces sp. C10-9-1]|uniref:Uma2 family endonuclease n=1 Tax=Streptomyces sp. C10-9-1 TaxID=1859285 RepID=UPI00211185E0|nr:Uma2 family endonuclease [Streptomyces sp. C10-9-1]MCQ6554046.1 Uma2 family endonuclease [Streptomyces sp. C10-9-1]